MIDRLKEKYGEKCSGIKLNAQYPKINHPRKTMSFCEGIKYSFDIPICLDEKLITCLGAMRSLSISSDSNLLAQELMKESNLSLSVILGYLQQVPKINAGFLNINLGITSFMEKIIPPDVYLIYMNPVGITGLLKDLAKYQIRPSVSDNPFLSVCGMVYATSLMHQKVSLSFGCKGARQNGGVNENEIVVGIPAKYASYLVN